MRDHAEVQARAAAILAEADEPALRASHAGFNPVAWILWHMARVEDGCLAAGVFGTRSVLDGAGWGPRLGVTGPANGFGMSRAEAAALAQALDVAALAGYREAVARRTQALAAQLWPERWWEPIAEADASRMAKDGVCRAPAGTAREALLHWWGLHHNYWHLGQCVAIRSQLWT